MPLYTYEIVFLALSLEYDKHEKKHYYESPFYLFSDRNTLEHKHLLI